MLDLYSIEHILLTTMVGFSSLTGCFNGEGEVGLSKYLQYRKAKRHESDEDDDDKDGMRKRRKFVSRNYEGYDPEAALSSEWY